MIDRIQLLIKLVDQRQSGRDIQFCNLGLRDIIYILHQRTDAVTVRRDDQALARLDLRDQGRMPVREDPFKRDLQRLRRGQLFGGQ